MINKRAELHLHTKSSDDISVIGVEEVIEKAEEYGLSAIAFTNLNNVQDFPEIARCARNTDMKVIYGVEVLYKSEADREIHKLTLLAKNQEGIKALYKVISSIERKDVYDVIDLRVLLQNRENLLVGSNDFKEVISYDYFEIHPSCNEQEEELNKNIYLCGKARGIPVVAVSNAHYINKNDAVCRDIVRVSMGFQEGEEHNLYLRTISDMLAEFKYLGEREAEEVVQNNPRMLADLIERVEPIKEGFYEYKIQDDYEQIEKICIENACAIYGNPLPNTVSERLKTELELIKCHNYASRYLIIYKITKHITDSGHYVGSRGTSGSVLVNFLLGISEINPLPPHYYCSKCGDFEESNLASDGFDLPERECPSCNSRLRRDGHHIPFESFMGIDGSKKPDFHINVSPEIQISVMEHMKTLFGRKNIARAGIIIRFWKNSAQEIIEAYEKKTNILFSTKEKERIVRTLTDVKRSEEIHPGGIVMIPTHMEWEDFTPIRKRAGMLEVTHFDFGDLRNTILKFDILCYTTFRFLELLQKNTDVKRQEINLKDSEVLALFRDFDIAGLPGFDQEFMWDLLERTMPESFSDFVKFNGLAHGTNVWTQNGEYLLEEGVPISKLPTMRDDIINDLKSIGIDSKTAYQFSEDVRRGWLARGRVSHENISLYKDITKSLGDWYYDYCSKIRYMFPKAHAMAYVYNDIRCLWFKKYYPKEFYETYIDLYCKDEE